jgi:antitoxin component YwqK of YwqJK toxin-antitoxin module
VGARRRGAEEGLGGVDGEDIGYHRNGKVAYRGRHKDGKQVGTWTWYDETGKVTSTKTHP